MKRHLLVFGPGYTAGFVMKYFKTAGWQVSATYRDTGRKEALIAEGYNAVDFNNASYTPDQPITDILCSVSPPEGGDPVLLEWNSWLEQQCYINSVHYLSSTNVYGNHDGRWVDENTAPSPSLDRGKRRIIAEKAWADMAEKIGSRHFIYRLAGIYGPGRNVFRSLKNGKSRRIIRKGQVFGRIHVSDITTAIWKAATSDHAGGIFNLADDMPTPPQELIEAGAAMLGIAPPPKEPFETAELRPMARSFYLESKRVKNTKVKQELGLNFKYPTYHEGLAALIKEETI